MNKNIKHLGFNYYQLVVRHLERGHKIFWFYDLLGCAEITHLTPKKKMISFLDIADERSKMTEIEFNHYNKGCVPEDIFRIYDKDGKELNPLTEKLDSY